MCVNRRETNQMKKLTAILLALVLLFALGACSKTEQAGEAEQTQIPVDPDVQMGKFDLPDIRFFDASLLDGSAVTADELFGDCDVTAINIWATWCPPCLDEMDELADFEKTLPDNVQLVTYCVDGAQHTDECAQILEDAGFEGTTMISATGDFTTLIEQMQYVPTTIFVDGVGRQTCDSLIGSPGDLAEAYTERINAALKAVGKSSL